MPDLHCSFCGKDQKQVRKLIGGNPGEGVPVGHICDECLFKCTQEMLTSLDLTPTERLQWRKWLRMFENLYGSKPPKGPRIV